MGQNGHGCSGGSSTPVLGLLAAVVLKLVVLTAAVVAACTDAQGSLTNTLLHRSTACQKQAILVADRD